MLVNIYYEHTVHVTGIWKCRHIYYIALKRQSRAPLKKNKVLKHTAQWWLERWTGSAEVARSNPPGFTVYKCYCSGRHWL